MLIQCTYVMLPMLISSLHKFYGRHHDLVLTVTKNPYLKWQWIFYFLRIIFFLLSLPILLLDMTVQMSNTCASYKLQEMLTLRDHLFLEGSVLLIFLDCCVVFLALLLSSFCVLCTHCCRFLWIFHLVFANVCFVLLFVLLFI